MSTGFDSPSQGDCGLRLYFLIMKQVMMRDITQHFLNNSKTMIFASKDILLPKKSTQR